MKTIVTFSGGKDSLAALLYVKNNLTKNFEVVFCDTGWEAEETYSYINEIDEKLGLNLVTLRSKKYKGLIDMAEKKKRFPSTKNRFCTVELKTIPMIDYLLDEVKDHVLIVQGIRASESDDRAMMSSQCRFFKYYFEPYSTNEKTIERLQKLSLKRELTPEQKKTLSKATLRLKKGHNDEKYHTYRKFDVLDFCSKYADDLVRPVFEWTAQQVIDYIVQNGIDPNPLYKKGASRVGCYPCLMSSHSDILSMIQRDPERMRYIQEQEERLGCSFFKLDFIPERFRTGQRINKKGELAMYSRAIDIEKYLTSKNATLDLFNPEPTSCMSIYGLCE